MKILLALIIAAISISTNDANASNIRMHDKGIYINTQPVEKAVVLGGEIYLRSSIRPCANYPGYPDKIYGDVYECYTSRELLSQHLNDQNILMLPDQDLSQYLIHIDQTFSCANRSTPTVVNYFGKNVYWFSGMLLATEYSNSQD